MRMRWTLLVSPALVLALSLPAEACGRHGRHHRGRLFHRRASCGAAYGYQSGSPCQTTVSGCASCGPAPIQVPPEGVTVEVPLPRRVGPGERERIKIPPSSEK